MTISPSAFTSRGLRVLARARRFSALITDGEETMRARTMQIAVGNGRFYGGGAVVEESAEIDDGHLDLYSLEMRNVWRLALGMRTFRSGAHGAWTDVRTARGVEFDIVTTACVANVASTTLRAARAEALVTMWEKETVARRRS